MTVTIIEPVTWTENDGPSTWKFFTTGHYVNGVLVRWPHTCPGSACAILRWLRRDEAK